MLSCFRRGSPLVAIRYSARRGYSIWRLGFGVWVSGFGVHAISWVSGFGVRAMRVEHFGFWGLGVGVHAMRVEGSKRRQRSVAGVRGEGTGFSGQG